MNMISTGAFLTEMDASTKKSSLVNKLVRAWEKKNAKVAQAGGVSLMALSLAACGSDDAAETSTTTTPAATTTTTVAPAASSLKLTAQTDDLSGSGAFDAGMVWSPGGDTRVESLQSEDRVEGTGTADSITISTNGGDMAPKFTGIETVGMTLSGATAGTLNLANSTGVTTVNLSSTDGNIGVTGLASTVAAKAHNIADAATNVFFNVKASALLGTADSMTVTVDGFAGSSLNIGSSAAAGVAGGGIETLSVVASGETSSIASLGSGATTVNVDADAQLTVSAFTSTAIGTLNASESSATVSFNVAANISANVFTYTGSAGADTLIATSGFTGTDSIAGGEGADTFSIRPAGGAANVTVGALNAASAAVFSGFETLDMRTADGGAGATAFTVDMDHVPGVTAINMRTADTNAKTVFTLNDLSAAQAGALTVLHTGTNAATDSEVIVDMKANGTDTVVLGATVTAATQVVEVNDLNSNIENLTLTVNGAFNTNVDVGAGSFATNLTVKGGAAATTMTLANTQTNALIDLSGVASNTTLTIGGTEQTVKGGTGKDTLTLVGTLTKDDVIDLGGGATDTISINNASVTTVNGLSNTLASTLAGNITNVERLTVSDALAQGLNMADFSGVTFLTLANSINAAQTVSNMTNGSTVVVTTAPNAVGDIMTLTTTGSTTGTSDSITVKYDGATNIDYGKVALAGYETITVNASEATATGTVRQVTIDMNITQSGGANTTVNFIGAETVILGTANDASIIDASALGGVLTMNAASTAGSQTITGSAGVDTLRGSSSADTINGGIGADNLFGGAGNDVINGGAGADEISPDAGAVIVTGGGGADDIHLTLATAGATAANNVTIVTDFNAGTSTSAVDQIEFTLAELNAMENDGAFATNVANFCEGDGSDLTTGGGTLIVQQITGDGQTGLAASELFAIQVGTYDNDDAIETAFAAGQITFSTGTVTDDDAVLIAYKTTAGHVNIAGAQFASTTGSSDSIDGVQTLVTLQNIAITDLDTTDFLIV